jgi:thiamine biosynthesis lipoprotein
VGSDKLVLSERGARFSVEGMEVDLGGIAKGFGIETAAQAMRKAGAKSALVVVGGEMRAVGRREDGSPWKVQVRDPRPGSHEPIVLRLDDKAVATSGDYARYFRVGERKLSHIVDPRTGWPVANVPSATVVAADAVTTDALATGISMLGPEKAIKLIDSLGDAECMMMARTEETEGTQVKLYYSKGFRALMEEGRK